MRKLSDLAKIVGGNIIGDSDMIIVGVGSIRDAGENTITFAENEELHKQAERTDAGVIIVPKGISQSQKTLLVVDHPRLAYAKIAHEFMPRPLKTGQIHPASTVHPDAVIAEGVSIHPGAVIDAGARIGQQSIIGPNVYVGRDVEIGMDCEIHGNVVIEYATIIGNRVIIHGGAVLGSDGYGFVTTSEGHYKLPQLGRVIIEDDVEIGANVTIDRGAIGDTQVGEGTKIDNLVHLGHNVATGSDCLLVALTGISGSTQLGKRVTLAGQSGTFGHLKIGNNVTVAARGLVTRDVEDGAFLSGAPAMDHRKDYRVKASARKVPDLLKKIKTLEKRLAKLEENK